MSDDDFGGLADEDLLEAFEQEQRAPSAQPSQRASQSFRQTTLWGSTLREDEPVPPQPVSKRAFRVDLPPEAPTHHVLDHDALKTWVYPLNLGAIRDYQFSIVKNGLFNNTLVALPTGLGKTFIAATIMLNYYRWTKTAKIVFLAPTKPLAAQQVEACLSIAGIPRSDATYLTGNTSPADREREWETKRLFFMTPQTFEHDLSKGSADPKSIVLLVVDEAHRATGNYAYVKVIANMRRFTKSFRVLALTATPGSTIEGVQEVIDSLGISHVEIRTEDSLDIRQYVHARDIDRQLLEPSDEIREIHSLLTPVLQPFYNRLAQEQIYLGKDPMFVHPFAIQQGQQKYMLTRGKHANQGEKFAMMAIFRVLHPLAYAIKLLNYHGIRPFYDDVEKFQTEAEAKGAKGSKSKKQIIGHPNFIKMMEMVQAWTRNHDFEGHPKMTFLCDKLLNHFMDAGEGSATRAIVFNESRASAEDIVLVLNKHKPLLRATVFVGQADSKKSRGMTQAQQIETIEKFKSGAFNVLVATSIGEEGLDIGQVDLIICYDASASPIRMLQRLGRTGRKRAGNILMLLMKGKEEDNWAKSQDNYEKMQRMICAGTEFNFRHDISTRIVPRDVKPEVDKRIVDIPIENSQNTSLPEPKKEVGRKKKASAKRFHMPDGVETGFQMASFFTKGSKKESTPEPIELKFLAGIPSLDKTSLTRAQEEELKRLYMDLPLGDDSIEEVMSPNLCLHPLRQRRLGPVEQLGHGDYTKRCVKLFKRLGKIQEDRCYAKAYGETDHSRYREIPVKHFVRFPHDHGDAERGFTGGSKRQHASSEDGFSGVPEPVAAKRRKAGKVFQGKENEDQDEPIHSDEPKFVTRKPAPAARKAAKRRKPQKPKSRFKGRGDDLEDYGDDCTRTSDMIDPEDSDSGADLLDFIVGDEEDISSLVGGSTSPTSIATTPARSTSRKAAPQPREESPDVFFKPTHLSQVSAVSEDLPDIAQMAPQSKTSNVLRKRMLSKVDESDDAFERQRRLGTGQRRKRTILDESDDE
jgi:ATP-dependent DNA helicase MPH1